VLIVDTGDAAPTPDVAAARMEAIQAFLTGTAGVAEGSVTFKETALADEGSSHNAAAAVGDAAAEAGATLCMMSSDVVHGGAVDANLLAEFVDCPLLLLP